MFDGTWARKIEVRASIIFVAWGLLREFASRVNSGLFSQGRNRQTLYILALAENVGVAETRRSSILDFQRHTDFNFALHSYQLPR